MNLLMRPVAWLMLSTITVLTLVPPSWRPVSPVPHNVEHFVIFLLMASAFALAYRRHAYALGAVLIAFAGALEALQIVIPGRHARLSDLLVNALGICAGIACGLLFYRTWPR